MVHATFHCESERPRRGGVDAAGQAGRQSEPGQNNGVTPLFIASQKGHAEVVSMLLAKQGVNVNQARIMVPRHFSLRVRTATPRWCRCCWPSRAST